MTLLQTDHFSLRPIDRKDAPVFAALCNDALIARNTARIPYPYSLKDAEEFTAMVDHAFHRGTEFAFAVCESGEIIGCCGVMRITNEVYELGYWIAAAARGKGAATEAARAVSHFAFHERGAQKLLAGHFADNPASGRVLEKAGFSYTGETRKQFSLGRGGEAETHRMTLARADFIPPQNAAFS